MNVTDEIARQEFDDYAAGELLDREEEEMQDIEDPAEACDRCSVHVPNGAGHHLAEGEPDHERLCTGCAEVAR